MKTRNVIIIGLIVIIVLAIVIALLYKSNKKVNVHSILFIGDSNTAANYSYADQLKKVFPGLNVKKIAVVGEKTDWMLQQAYNELNNYKYDVVAILGGSNDIYALGKTDALKNNLNAIYNLAHSKGSKVLAITPPNKNFYINKTDQKQILLNDLVDWMKKNKNIDYLIDFHKITDNKSFFNSSDGYLHANANAHNILAQQAAQKLKLTA